MGEQGDTGSRGRLSSSSVRVGHFGIVNKVVYEERLILNCARSWVAFEFNSYLAFILVKAAMKILYLIKECKMTECLLNDFKSDGPFFIGASVLL
jgi:hypothetical protein